MLLPGRLGRVRQLAPDLEQADHKEDLQLVPDASHWSESPAAEICSKLIGSEKTPCRFHGHCGSRNYQTIVVRASNIGDTMTMETARVQGVLVLRGPQDARDARTEPVLNEGGHRNTAMLDLSVTEPTDKSSGCQL